MGNVIPEFIPRRRVWRRKRVRQGKDFHKEFIQKDSDIKVDGLWCRACRKTRVWKDIYFSYYLYKGAWWRKACCTWCDAVLRDEAME